MNDGDDLDALERELGPSLRVALRRIAAEITSDRPTASGATDHHRPAQTVLDGVVTVDLERSSPASPTRQRGRPWLGAAAAVSAAAAVVLAIAAVVLPRLDNDKPADEAAQAVAESFMAGWVGGDGDAVAALLAPDAFFDAWTAQTLPALDDWYRAVGWDYRNEGCEVISAGRVWCDYTVENDLTRAFDHEPIAGSFALVIDGGAVTSVRDDVNTGAYRDIWTAFAEWVRERHPDDVDDMYTFAAGYPRVDPVSIALWTNYSREFVDSGAAYIARARTVCTDAHKRYDDLVAASAPTEEAKSEAAARVLETALVELQSVPPPAAVQASVDRGSSLIRQLIDAFGESGPSGAPPAPTAGARPSPSRSDVVEVLTSLAHAQIGLERCAIDPW